GFGERAAGQNAVAGDGGAVVVGDEGGLARGVERDVAGAGASGGHLVDGPERASRGVGDKKAGDGGGGVVDGIDGVEAATAYGVGREGEEGRTQSFGGQDWLREKAGGRVEAGEIDSPGDALCCVCAEVDENRLWGEGFPAEGREEGLGCRKAQSGGECGEGEKKSASGEHWR